MKNRKLQDMVLSALFLALGFVLPFLTGQIPQVGSMLLPMHIPVLLCGFFCGPFWGLAVGAVCPLFRSLILTMPPMEAAIPMAFELAAYGLVSGAAYRAFPKKPVFVYISLLAAMVAGRIVWGAVRLIMSAGTENAFPMSAFISGAVTTAIPGMIVQIVLIPILVITLRRRRMS